MSSKYRVVIVVLFDSWLVIEIGDWPNWSSVSQLIVVNKSVYA